MAHLTIPCMKISPAAVSCTKLIEEDSTARGEGPHRAAHPHLLQIWNICCTSQASLRRVRAFHHVLPASLREDMRQDGLGCTLFVSHWTCRRGSKPGLDTFAGIGGAKYSDGVWVLTRNTHCDRGKGEPAPVLQTRVRGRLTMLSFAGAEPIRP